MACCLEGEGTLQKVVEAQDSLGILLEDHTLLPEGVLLRYHSVQTEDSPQNLLAQMLPWKLNLVEKKKGLEW